MAEILRYPKSMGFTKHQVEMERLKLPNPDIWEHHQTSTHYILKLNRTKAHRKLASGKWNYENSWF